MSRERRQSFRCKAGDLPAEGVLHTRRGDVTVKLNNRSSGGFGVMLRNGSSSHVNNDEEIAFSLGEHSCLVRVAHQSDSGDGVVIGLEVLRELPSHLSGNYSKRKSSEGRSSHLLRYSMMAACGVLIVINIPWNYAFSAFQTEELPEKTVAEVNEEDQRLFAEEGYSNETRLADSFVQLDHLKSREAVTRLNLTTSQQQNISQIVRETTYSMEAIFKHRESMSDSEWTELGLQLLQNSAHRIEASLTDEQRVEWAKLARRK